jgi:hypothetical protein
MPSEVLVYPLVSVKPAFTIKFHNKFYLHVKMIVPVKTYKLFQH